MNVSSLLFWLLLGLCLLFLLLVGARWYVAREQTPLGPSAAEPVPQQLSACPSTPNCVGSQEREPSVAPFPLLPGDQGAESLALLAQLIEAMPRSAIKRQEAGYLHAEFESWLFGFIDDLELLVNHTPPQIEVRSAARLGYSDLGVNRRRVEQLRKGYLEAGTSQQGPKAPE